MVESLYVRNAGLKACILLIGTVCLFEGEWTHFHKKVFLQAGRLYVMLFKLFYYQCPSLSLQIFEVIYEWFWKLINIQC